MMERNKNMKIAIIGAGAMGCLYGAYLSKQNDVILLDSFQPQVDAINENGVTLIEPDGARVVYSDVRAYLSGTYQEAVDLVIVFVKTNYTEDALEENRKLFGAATIAMTLQNGAGNDQKLAKYADAEHIVIGTSRHNAVNMGNGVSKHAAPGLTCIGSRSGGKAQADRVASALKVAGFETEVSDDIWRIIWSKLFVNLSINCITALTQMPIGYVVENKFAWNIAKKLIEEAVLVAQADGVTFDLQEAIEAVRHVCIDAAKGYSSMSQDRKNNRKMEIDAINGFVVAQAKTYGIAVPYNTMIVNLIHAIEGTYEQ